MKDVAVQSEVVSVEVDGDTGSDNTSKMRVVALISGGKDSCYNMMQCVAEGHEIVALANLYPKGKGNNFLYIPGHPLIITSLPYR